MRAYLGGVRFLWLALLITPARADLPDLVEAHEKAVRAVRFAKDYFATTDGKIVMLWDAGTRKQIRVLETEFKILGIRFAPGRPLLAVYGYDDKGGVTALFEANQPGWRKTVRAEHPVFDIAFSPDAKRIATATAGRYAKRIPEGETEPGAVTIWTTSDAARVVSFPVSGRSVAWSSDGKTIAAADGSRIRLLNVKEKTHFAINDITAPRRFSGLRAVSCSPKEPLLAYLVTVNTRRMSWLVQLKALSEKGTAIERPSIGGRDRIHDI